MRSRAVLTALVAVAFAGAAFAGGGKIPWVDDYEKGLALAKETGKPLMLKFWAAG